MKISKPVNQGISTHDYGTKLQGALSWLGDRYLLAEPVNRRSDETRYLVNEAERWQSRSQGAGVTA